MPYWADTRHALLGSYKACLIGQFYGMPYEVVIRYALLGRSKACLIE